MRIDCLYLVVEKSKLKGSWYYANYRAIEFNLYHRKELPFGFNGKTFKLNPRGL